jgi:hypothetical protein
MTGEEERLERQLYIAGIIFLAAAAVLGFFYFKYLVPRLDAPCFFRMITGLYCPGCGGTRAVSALAHGHLLKSIWYHPVVAYSVLIYAAYMISHTLAMFLPRFKGIRYRGIYLYAALAIVLVNFVVKNVLLLGFDIKM